VDTAFRCSVHSEALDEPMLATASHVRNWVLIQHDGPWGLDAFRDARGLAGAGPALTRRARAHGVRPVLIRRVGRAGGPRVTVFAVHSGPDDPWIERLSLERIEDAAELDLEALGRGTSVHGEPHTGPLYLVCTHGRHDACCAERGRPVALAMDGAAPDATWECSHIGGDRFAGNLVAFPHGLYFGRVEPKDGPVIARRYEEGRIDLERFRGRSCHATVAQAAEQFARRERSLDGVEDVKVLAVARGTRGAWVTLATPQGDLRVELDVEEGPQQTLTCRRARPPPPPRYRMRGIASVSGAGPGP
jgi:hypothetical protein